MADESLEDSSRSLLELDSKPRVRVSSVLNRDVKQFGKQFMFDNNEETCWNSDQGSPQFVTIDFNQDIHVSKVLIQFQGGFAGKECQLEGGSSSNSLTPFAAFYPDDVNSLQSFSISSNKTMRVIKLIFPNSSDFFGRITIYKLDVLGTVV